ncbi:MAG: hypothetical protein HKN63_06125 [Rhodobacteraceae bacterium]|nr:hypothetical protein [Paracoccaceae bacterium]
MSCELAAFTWAELVADGQAGPIDWIAYDQHDDVPHDAEVRFPASRVKLRFDETVAIGGCASRSGT